MYLKSKITWFLGLFILMVFFTSCQKSIETKKDIDNFNNTSLETTSSTTSRDFSRSILSTPIRIASLNQTLPDHTLTVNKVGSGIISSNPSGISCGSTCSKIYSQGTTVVLTATPSNGYSFSSWTGCNSINGNVCTVSMSASKNVTATFSSLEYKSFYITQAAQNPSNSRTLVANRKGLARLFITDTISGNNTNTNVDLYVYNGSNYLGKIDLLGPSTVPSSYSQSNYNSSYNAVVPANWMTVNTRYYITINSSVGSNVFRYPTSSTASLNIVNSPTLNIKWVPINSGGNVPSMSYTNRQLLLSSTRKYMPIVNISETIHSTVTTTENLSSSSGWINLIIDLEFMRVSEQGSSSSNVYYHAIIDDNVFAAYCGLAYTPGRTGISSEKTSCGADTVAHELGHNWNRKHVASTGNSQCGTPSSTDPSFPYLSGSIGVWGVDVYSGGTNLSSYTLKSPNIFEDTMTYCPDEWISDYNYEQVAMYRAANPDLSQNTGEQLILAVSGTIDSNDVVSLRPAYTLSAFSDLSSGPYKLQLLSSTSNILQEIQFTTVEIADFGEELAAFFVNVPVTEQILNNLSTIHVIDLNNNILAIRESNNIFGESINGVSSDISISLQGDTVTFSWDSNLYPSGVLRNEESREVLMFGSSAGSLSINVNVITEIPTVEIMLSNGVSSNNISIDTNQFSN